MRWGYIRCAKKTYHPTLTRARKATVTISAFPAIPMCADGDPRPRFFLCARLGAGVGYGEAKGVDLSVLELGISDLQNHLVFEGQISFPHSRSSAADKKLRSFLLPETASGLRCWVSRLENSRVPCPCGYVTL